MSCSCSLAGSVYCKNCPNWGRGEVFTGTPPIIYGEGMKINLTALLATMDFKDEGTTSASYLPLQSITSTERMYAFELEGEDV